MKRTIFYWLAPLVYAAALTILSGLIPEFGRWYSLSPHRGQTEALVHGRLALSYSPYELQHDLSWSGGGVQQVWGLGVPFWRVPFELISHAFGRRGFPDRVAFAVALLLTARWIMLVLCPTWLERKYSCGETVQYGSAIGIGNQGNGLQWGFCTAMLTLSFPAFINLLRSSMSIYEEVLAYVFLYGVVLLATTIRFIQQPKLGSWSSLCAAAGFGAFVRPTLLFYGLSTLIVAWISLQKSKKRGCFGFPNRQWLVGPFLFCLGGALLFVTNWIRFGSGLEFGHRLNLQVGDSLLGSMYATRFGHPSEN